MNRAKNKSLWTLITDMVCLVASFILKGFQFDPLGNLRPTGLVIIYICLILGTARIVFSLTEKSVVRAVLDFSLILAFPIVMFMGSLLIK